MADTTGSSVSSSSSSNQSTSTPVVVPTPQSDFSLQLAQAVASMGSDIYNWAQQTYANTGAVTDTMINNYLNLAQGGTGLAGGLLNQYEQTFAPLENQYAAEAQTYASAPRIQTRMGAAESDAMQAGNQAKINAEQQLQSYGIDPSSGRYADLERSSDIANAASAASAGQQERLAVENEGQQRKLNAIAMGQQLPGQAVNALNSAYQGVAGAENSNLGQANVGVNLMGAADPYLNTAIHPTQPLQGQNSQSTGQSGSVGFTTRAGSSPSSPSSSSGNRAAGNQNGTQAPSAFPSKVSPAYTQNPFYTGPGGYTPPGILNTGGGGMYQTPADQIDYGNGGNAWGPTDTGNFTDPSQQSYFNMADYNPTANTSSWDSANYLSPSQSVDTFSNYAPTQTADNGYGGYSPTQDTSSYNYGGGNYSDPYGSDMTSSSFDTTNYDSGSFDNSGGGYSSSDNFGGDYYGAKGGMVPAGMSPSRGRKVDDVPANIQQTGGRAHLNVGEFVIPRDVVAHKGTEFFRKLIENARKTRVGGHPQHAPQFMSRRPSYGVNHGA